MFERAIPFGTEAPGRVGRSPLHFARFEFKYLLNAEQRRALEEDLLFFLELDRFVVDLPDHKYPVRSLYFDDPWLSAFHDKIDGLHTRSKFRVRAYERTPTPNGARFLEVKGRHNNLVFKHRTPIIAPGLDWTELSGERLTDALMDHAASSDVLEQFRYAVPRRGLRPVALIDYERRPYISKYDPHFRITFDEKLSAIEADGLFPATSATPRAVLAGYTVMEVKLRHHMPSWFHRLLQAHELRRVSISKICAGMETLGLAQDEN